MEKEISGNCYFNLLKCLVWFLLLAFLTISPVYTYSGSEADEADVTDEIRMHMETAGLTDAEITEKLTQLAEELANGLSFNDSCTHCHGDRKRQGGTQ